MTDFWQGFLWGQLVWVIPLVIWFVYDMWGDDGEDW